MSDSKTPNLTPVDSLVCDDGIQTLKACIPFLGMQEQSILLAYAKFIEFKRSIHLMRDDSGRLQACSVQPELKNPLYMLNHVRTYCSEAQRQTIDSLLNVLQIIQMYQVLQTPSQMDENDLSSEQKELFRQFSETVQRNENEEEAYHGSQEFQ